jgi:hypothetical protein
VATQPVNQFCPPDHDPRLGSTEQLVRRERDEVRALAERVRHARFVVRMAVAVVEQAGPDVEQEGDPVPVGERREVGWRGRRGEADHPIVRGMHLEDHAGLLADRGPIVADPGPVRCAHLGEAGP